MKISLWNVARLKNCKPAKIVEILSRDNSDIIVLTEASNTIDLSKTYPFVLSTQNLQELDPKFYAEGEVRVMVYSKFKILRKITTYDAYTSLCIDIETQQGPLRLYGSIIGVLGGNGPGRKGYLSDLKHQLVDYHTLLQGKNACIAGDFNTSFTGFPYPSKVNIKALKDCFAELRLTNLSERYVDLKVTDEKNINVDHIVISDAYLKKVAITADIWNQNKKLSDHIGYSIRFNE